MITEDGVLSPADITALVTGLSAADWHDDPPALTGPIGPPDHGG